jgi:hypothetical protein
LSRHDEQHLMLLCQVQAQTSLMHLVQSSNASMKRVRSSWFSYRPTAPPLAWRFLLDCSRDWSFPMRLNLWPDFCTTKFRWGGLYTAVGACVVAEPCHAYAFVANVHNLCGPSHGTRSTTHHTSVCTMGSLPHGGTWWSGTWGVPSPWQWTRTWTLSCQFCILHPTSPETQLGLLHLKSSLCMASV